MSDASSRAKHTLGPWSNIVKMDGFTAVGANTLIARVFSTRFKDIANEEANARLISAAPELLERLKQAVAYFGDDSFEPDSWATESRRLIAKAEGRGTSDA